MERLRAVRTRGCAICQYTRRRGLRPVAAAPSTCTRCSIGRDALRPPSRGSKGGPAQISQVTLYSTALKVVPTGPSQKRAAAIKLLTWRPTTAVFDGVPHVCATQPRTALEMPAIINPSGPRVDELVDCCVRHAK